MKIQQNELLTYAIKIEENNSIKRKCFLKGKINRFYNLDQAFEN